MRRRLVHFLTLAAVLLGVPFACAWLGGRRELFDGVCAFPPRTEDWGLDPSKLWNMRRPFSWPVFLLLSGGVLVSVWPFARRLVSGGRAGEDERRTDERPTPNAEIENAASGASTVGCRSGAPVSALGVGRSSVQRSFRFPFPWFGWAGAALCAGGWVLAWNRFAWFAGLQPHTFLPLWAGYILVVNALCVRRSGRCLMTSHPGAYAALLPVSAAFWWFFEYLNRYVWNWYYRGVDGMGAAEYALFATFSFATVLPAVTATAEWLGTFRPFADGRLCGLGRVNLRSPAGVAGLALAAAAGLTGIVFCPAGTFPLLWISPLAVFLAVQVLLGEATVLDRLARGDWRLVVRFALAALICGLVWELWNFRSLAKWVYAVPHVHAFQIFEMPVIGFAGYLPFGLECAAVAAWVLPALAGAGAAAERSESFAMGK
ncbi:MAG: hypothetical protein LBW77_00790 [Verrucomicrobiota bacterium]|jgi:hypothetical protein|nr:hypothetical protein [Verrucomicrobiota bacterium]